MLIGKEFGILLLILEIVRNEIIIVFFGYKNIIVCKRFVIFVILKNINLCMVKF